MSRKFAIRCVAAVWCLACFVLVQSYSCVLTSVLTLPSTPHPLINSIYDIPKVKGVNPLVVRGSGPDVVISVTRFVIQSSLTLSFKQYDVSLF